MKYDDLLNTPYKTKGRSAEGFDCYGLVAELCRRAGTPLKDPDYTSDEVPINKVNEYIEDGLNVREIPEARVGAIVEMEVGGKVHVGYIVERDKIIHATRNFGVRISPLNLVKTKRFFEVIK